MRTGNSSVIQKRWEEVRVPPSLERLAERGVEVLRDPRFNSKTIAIGGSALFFIVTFSAFVVSLQSVSTPPPQVPAAVAAPLEAIIETETPPSEINIARTGLILLRGAEVLAIDGPVLTVRTTWHSVVFTWTVQTNATKYEKRYFGTKFINDEGERIAPSDVDVGDFVTITGELDTSFEQPTLTADSVRRLQTSL